MKVTKDNGSVYIELNPAEAEAVYLIFGAFEGDDFTDYRLDNDNLDLDLLNREMIYRDIIGELYRGLKVRNE